MSKMPKNNQAVICGRDYKQVPKDETQSPTSTSNIRNNTCQSPNLALESDGLLVGVSAEDGKKTDEDSSEKSSSATAAADSALERRLSKVKRAEEEADRQLLRVSAVTFDDDNSNRRTKNESWRIDLESRSGSAFGRGLGFKSTRRRSSQQSIRSGESTRQKLIRTLCSLSMWRKRAKHFIPILLLIVYSASGGLMFWLLEGRGREAKAKADKAAKLQKQDDARNLTTGRFVELIEREHREYVDERLTSYEYANYSKIDNGTEILPTKGNSSCIDLGYYVNSIIDALNETYRFDDLFSIDDLLVNFTKTMSPLLKEHDDRDWTFWGSVFYCGTIYTTIGYGYMTAQTQTGKALTIVYALLGIPLVLYNLSTLGRGLMRVIWNCYVGALKGIDLCRPARYRRSSTLEKREMAEFPFWIAISITVGWTLMCSALFQTWEKWDFFTSFYFFFQSLTTIGFGDVKPERHDYMVWSFFLILIGLALVSMCWTLLQMKFDYLITAATKKITEQFVNTELDDGEMATDGRAIENEIEKITSGENAFLANLVSDDRREALMNEWRHRAKMKNVGSQTRIKTENKHVQTIECKEIKETGAQTPDFMSPKHKLSWDVPYRETRRATLSVSAHSTPHRHSNDEFRNLLQGLKTIIGECRETLSNKDLTSGLGTQSGQVVGGAAAGVSPMRRKLKSTPISRASTAASVSMLEL